MEILSSKHMKGVEAEHYLAKDAREIIAKISEGKRERDLFLLEAAAEFKQLGTDRRRICKAPCRKAPDHDGGRSMRQC